jgi:2-polyprenyl-3-methyl-5-hydroxy-6-metoxy-1,4-benzoquinol methylase
MNTTESSEKQYDRLWRDLWANTHVGGPMARTRYRQAVQWLGLRPNSRNRVLDVGAGNGAFMSEALKKSPGLDIYGAEFAQAAIDIAHPLVRSRIARCNLQGQEPLPWGGQFDFVTCMEVLEHLPDDQLAFRHIANAVRPGGRVLITVPAWQSKWGPTDVTAGHVRRYEPKALEQLITQGGLRLLKLKCWGGLMTALYLGLANRIGPEKVMQVRPTGVMGLAAATIYYALMFDDVIPFGKGFQLIALAEKPDNPL